MAYQILPNGTVNHVEIIESNVQRSLQQSSIKALKQWRYSNTEQHHEGKPIHHEVIFKFSGAKK